MSVGFQLCVYYLQTFTLTFIKDHLFENDKIQFKAHKYDSLLGNGILLYITHENR